MNIDRTSSVGPLKAPQPKAAPRETRQTETTPAPQRDQAELGTSRTDGQPAVHAADAPPKIVVLKDGGVKALVSEINKAKKSIDVKIYIITARQKEINEALKSAAKRGVDVRLMVEDDPFYWKPGAENPSQEAIKDLVAAGAKYKPDNPQFSKNRVTHEKSFTIDGKKALILTGNIANSAFTTNLDLGAVVLQHPQLVKQVQTVFDADWDRRALPEMVDEGLVISPDNAREKLTDLIGSAKKSLRVIQQGMSDNGMIKAIGDKAASGVKTDLILTDPGIAQNNMQAGAYFATRGAKVTYLDTPYVHAKAISVDSGDANKGDDISYVGSQNFSMSALDRNRELGYIFSDPGDQVESIFNEYQPQGFEIPSKQLISDNSAVGSSFGKAARLAEKSIVIETNLFSDNGLISALKKAQSNGIEVQVMMPKNPYPWDPNFDLNEKTAAVLREAGVEVKFTDSATKAVQGSVMLVDDQEAIVSADSLTRSAATRNENFAILDIDPAEVKDLKTLLAADWEGGKAAKGPVLSSDLVVSPLNARAKLVGMIKDARSSIDLESRQLSDAQVVANLKAKAKAGIPVRVVVEDKEKLPDWQKKIYDDLIASGVQLETMSAWPLRNNYINIDDKQAYVGGHEMTRTSLDEARGYGLVATHPKMITIGDKRFQEHFLVAALDQVDKTAYLEKAELNFPQDRLMIDILEERAMYGVKVDLAVGNPKYAFIDNEILRLNQRLRDLAKLDPVNDRDQIVAAYGMKFEPETALAAHQKLVEAVKALPPKGELVEIKAKDPNSIKSDYIKLDGRTITLRRISGGPETPEEGGGAQAEWQVTR